MGFCRQAGDHAGKARNVRSMTDYASLLFDSVARLRKAATTEAVCREMVEFAARLGFEFDVATLSGNPVKLEMWAMPGEDEAVKSIYAKYLPKLKAPQKLADLLEQAVADDSPYAAVFVPGGHGVLAGIPHSREVKRLLNAFLAKDRYIITLCHGPACLLAPAVEEKPEDYPFKGYEICVFPDALDTGANLEIGYMPGPLPWLVGENLQKLGVKILNKGITGQVHRDRKLLTGDSPLASNNLGKLAAKTLLEAFAR